MSIYEKFLEFPTDVLKYVYCDLSRKHIWFKNEIIFQNGKFESFDENLPSSFSSLQIDNQPLISLDLRSKEFLPEVWKSKVAELYSNYARCVPCWIKIVNFPHADKNALNFFTARDSFHYDRLALELYVFFHGVQNDLQWEDPTHFYEIVGESCVIYRNWLKRRKEFVMGITKTKALRVCKEFIVEERTVVKKNIPSCARELLQMTEPLWHKAASEENFMDRLYTPSWHKWCKTWEERQCSYYYGKYAALAVEISKLGATYNPRVFRSRMAYQVLKGRDYSVTHPNLKRVTKDVLRMLKTSKCYDTMPLFLDSLYPKIARLLDIYKQYCDDLSSITRLEDLYTVGNEQYSWKSISIRNLTPQLNDMIQRVYKSANADKADIETPWKSICEALQNYGYANTILFVAHFGNSFSFSAEVIKECQDVASLLSSPEDSQVEIGAGRLNEMIAKLRAEYAKLCPKDAKESFSGIAESTSFFD